jgi:4'-phosphopantetheinyl transferase
MHCSGRWPYAISDYGKAAMLYYSDIGSLDLETILPSLPNSYRAGIERKRHAQDRRLALGSRLLLGYALGEKGVCNAAIERDGNGKPHLTDHPDMHFNLSHSGHLVACAVSDREVGVDVEQVSRSDPRIAERFFTAEEKAHIARSDDPGSALCELWVLKEAFMKMTSLGFRLPLDAFSIDMGDPIRVRVDPDATDLPDIPMSDRTGIGFGLWSIADGTYRLAFCSSGDTDTPEPVSFQRLSPIEISSRHLMELGTLAPLPF